MPTTVGILTFMSWINLVLNAKFSMEKVLTPGPGSKLFDSERIFWKYQFWKESARTTKKHAKITQHAMIQHSAESPLLLFM